MTRTKGERISSRRRAHKQQWSWRSVFLDSPPPCPQLLNAAVERRPKIDRIPASDLWSRSLFERLKNWGPERNHLQLTLLIPALRCEIGSASQTHASDSSQICSVTAARPTLGGLVSLTGKHYCRAAKEQMKRKVKSWFHALSPFGGRFFLIPIQSKREVEENPFHLWCWRILCVLFSRSITW